MVRLFAVLAGVLLVLAFGSGAFDVPAAYAVPPSDCRTVTDEPTAQDVADCLSTYYGQALGYMFLRGRHPDQSCAYYLKYWTDATPQSPVPSCAAVAQGLNIIERELPAWVNCTGKQTARSAGQIASCLGTYLPSKGQTRESLTICKDLERAYNEAIRVGGYSGAYVPVPCDVAAQAATAPLEQLVAQDLADHPLAISKPGDPCGDFKATDTASHFLDCMRPVAGTTATACDDVLTSYRARVEAAYSGVLPDDFKDPSCEVATSYIAYLKSELAIEQRPLSVAAAESRPINWGNVLPVVVVLTFFAVVVGLIVGAVMRASKWRRRHARNLQRTEAPVEDEASIRRAAQEKQGEFAYAGEAEANFPLHLSTGSTVVTMTFSFRVVRNLAAMTHREREFVKIYRLMHTRGWLDDDSDDRIHFGLAWGNGNASVERYEFAIPAGVANQHGIRTIEDALRWYAKEKTVNVESVISELLNAFGRLRAANPDDPLVKEIAATLSSGNRWFGSDDIPGSPFDHKRDRPGIFLGMLPEAEPTPLLYYGDGSLVTIAPPGAGKTQCHIIPNLFFWNGPAVVLDVKGELWEKTSAFRSKLGPVYRFAPFQPKKTHRFNPLEAVRADPFYIWEDAMQLAHLMIVPSGSSHTAFWEQSAQRLLAGFITHVCRQAATPKDRTMADVLDLASGLNIEEFIVEAAAATELREFRREGASFENTPEQTRAGILAQLKTNLQAWSGAQVEAATSDVSDWKLSDIRDRNATLYICIRPDEIEKALSVLRVLIGQHINSLFGEEPNKKDVLFFVDEFPQLREMKPIEEGISTGRSSGIRLWLIAQSLSQIEHHYGNRAQGMLGQCAIRSFMNPSLQDGTAEKLAKDVGYFDSVIDGHREQIVEPQALAGPEFENNILTFAVSTKPVRLEKFKAHKAPQFVDRMGETSWPPSDQ